MDYAFLGKTGVKVSRLALGTMTFGGDADAAADGPVAYREAPTLGDVTTAVSSCPAYVRP